MKYANKRVKIESKEHLDHVIKVTGMVMGHAGMRDLMIKKIGNNLHVCFDEGFDDDRIDWGYDYDRLINESEQLEEIFIPLPNPFLKDGYLRMERTLNDIRGRLDLDHLNDDELVEYLCGGQRKEWDGVEPLRVGHVVRHGEHVVNVSLVDESRVAGLVNGTIWVIHVDNLQPIKSEAERVFDEYHDLNANAVDIIEYTEWLLNRERSKV